MTRKAQKRNANGNQRDWRKGEKGQSGNPGRRFGQPDGNPVDRGGRPKSLARRVRDEVGEDGEKLIELLMAIARRRGSAWGRVQAIKELLDRGWGKAPQEITVREESPNATVNLLKYLTDDELEIFERARER